MPTLIEAVREHISWCCGVAGEPAPQFTDAQVSAALLAEGFDPAEPRDAEGRWSPGGGGGASGADDEAPQAAWKAHEDAGREADRLDDRLDHPVRDHGMNLEIEAENKRDEAADVLRNPGDFPDAAKELRTIAAELGRTATAEMKALGEKVAAELHKSFPAVNAGPVHAKAAARGEALGAAGHAAFERLIAAHRDAGGDPGKLREALKAFRRDMAKLSRRADSAANAVASKANDLANRYVSSLEPD